MCGGLPRDAVSDEGGTSLRGFVGLPVGIGDYVKSDPSAHCLSADRGSLVREHERDCQTVRMVLETAPLQRKMLAGEAR